MEKTIIIIAALAVAVGVGVYIVIQQPELLTNTLTNKVSVPKPGGSNVFGSLESLLSSGKNLKCTWSFEETSGTSWVKNKMVYNEINTGTEQGKTNTIMKDNCIWVWSEGESQGIKTCFDSYQEMVQEAEPKQPPSSEDTGEPEFSTDVKYNCEPTAVDDSKFVPPTDIEFSAIEHTLSPDTDQPQEIEPEEIDPEQMEEIQKQIENMVQ